MSRILLGVICGLAFGVIDVITKAYAPIIGMGALGGTAIGILVGRFGR
jgi:hypothetical protein